jgi:glutamine cyclotransferase
MTFGRALLGALALAVAGCAAAVPAPAPASAPAPAPAVERLRPTVLAELPHDTDAFTQGLELADGTLYEGTGLAGRSRLRELDPATGAVRREVPLPGSLFGEGITVVDDRIWQLTWRDGVVLEWDRAGLTLLRQVPLDGEGWGLCRDGDRLVRSDGTDRLRFHDPESFAETGSVAVTLDGEPVTEINELECVDGQVWANIWQTDRIVRIDPADGRVTAVVDAAGLLDEERRADADVLNGIAALGGDEYLLTGKLWPASFRVRFTGA